METETEKKTFSVRPTADLHDRLKEAADWMGQSLNAFVLGAAAQQANSVLESRDRIKIEPQDAKMIIRLLDAEPKPNDALAKAYRKHAEIIGE